MSYFGNDIPDHPVIQNLERTGYPDGREPEQPHCPACYAEEIETAYDDAHMGIVGCENCVESKDWDNLTDEELASFRKSPEGYPLCPLCGKPFEKIYFPRKETVKKAIGCDCCIAAKDAFYVQDCYYRGKD